MVVPPRRDSLLSRLAPRVRGTRFLSGSSVVGVLPSGQEEARCSSGSSGRWRCSTTGAACSSAAYAAGGAGAPPARPGTSGQRGAADRRRVGGRSAGDRPQEPPEVRLRAAPVAARAGAAHRGRRLPARRAAGRRRCPALRAAGRPVASTPTALAAVAGRGAGRPAGVRASWPPSGPGSTSCGCSPPRAGSSSDLAARAARARSWPSWPSRRRPTRTGSGWSSCTMLALYRSGRQGEALAAFQAHRRRLADDLGVEPGASSCGTCRSRSCARSPGSHAARRRRAHRRTTCRGR